MCGSRVRWSPWPARQSMGWLAGTSALAAHRRDLSAQSMAPGTERCWWIICHTPSRRSKTQVTHERGLDTAGDDSVDRVGERVVLLLARPQMQQPPQAVTLSSSISTHRAREPPSAPHRDTTMKRPGPLH
jgi:hypothetical protein